ncbi:MAG: 2-amino-4-hydroxy-6-hydroxymethyldihydropteridine diphosphokinase [Pseudomonadota bacterium]
MSKSAIAYLGLGGNVGDVKSALQWAHGEIGQLPSTSIIAVSPLYKTPPWGITTQNWFLNACLGIETGLKPHALLRALVDIELRAGRKRDVRWGPRTLDIDILTYGDVSIRTPDLTIPHPRLLDRAFVMIPLAAIAGDMMIGRSHVRTIASALDEAGIEIEAEEWTGASSNAD